ncbi:MAG: hypothetical protein L0L93_06190 [Brevibacterium sp.]|nr:hypothetical protein [Brevibacterium sp.]
MSTYGEKKKAWASEWAKMRKEYLSGKLMDVLVLPIDGGPSVRWECPACGETGTPVASEKLALTAGRGHMNVHVTPEDIQELEDMKVLRMPPELLSPFQRRRRDELEAPDQ